MRFAERSAATTGRKTQVPPVNDFFAVPWLCAPYLREPSSSAAGIPGSRITRLYSAAAAAPLRASACGGRQRSMPTTVREWPSCCRYSGGLPAGR